MNDLRLRLIIDGQEGITTIKLTEAEYDKLFNKFKGFPGFPPAALTSTKALQIELLKTTEATQETAEATAEFIKYYQMSEVQIEQVVQALREEQRQLGQGSAEYKQHTSALLNIANAQTLLHGGQLKVVSGSNAARMAVGQFGYALGDAGMIAVDFRMFLLSIGNNFPFIVQGLAQVSKEAKEAGVSMGSFLKNNIDTSMKMVLGANALVLALQILPAIFKAINEESSKAAEEGMKALNREIEKMTSTQVKDKLNSLKGSLEAISVQQRSQHPGIQIMGWLGMDITGLGAQKNAYENFVEKVTDKTKENEELSKSRKLALELEIADYNNRFKGLFRSDNFIMPALNKARLAFA